MVHILYNFRFCDIKFQINNSTFLYSQTFIIQKPIMKHFVFPFFVDNISKLWGGGDLMNISNWANESSGKKESVNHTLGARSLVTSRIKCTKPIKNNNKTKNWYHILQIILIKSDAKTGANNLNCVDFVESSTKLFSHRPEIRVDVDRPNCLCSSSARGIERTSQLARHWVWLR